MNPSVEPLNEVEDAIVTRRSVRSFLAQLPPRSLVERILELASRAPSGTNMQPWHVHVVTGALREALSARLLEAHDGGPGEEEYAYYPPRFFEPYLSRRRKIGWDLYGLLGIARGERERSHHQHGRNYRFFDAPVGMIFTIDRRLERGSWLDYGMFLDNIMLLARSYGLDTCPQAAFAPFARVIREVLPLPAEHTVLCGMALGYANPEAPENRLVTERAPLAEFATFHGWPQ